MMWARAVVYQRGQASNRGKSPGFAFPVFTSAMCCRCDARRQEAEGLAKGIHGFYEPKPDSRTPRFIVADPVLLQS
jgi:hypothetical protein